MYYEQISILLTIIISYCLPLIICSASYVDSRYEDCAPVKSFCGLQQKISYPFWDSSIVSSYCGHPGFKLKCEDNTSLTISILNQKYKILNIDYDAKALTISKPQLVGGPCPKTKTQLTNTTLDLNIFTFASESENATLFYDCNVRQFSDDPPYAFTCNFDSYSSSSSSSSNTVGFMAINETWEKVLGQICSFQINVPVLRTRADDLANGATNIPNVLSAGFMVKWEIDADGQCQDCANSGGRCGYNQTLNTPICFCQNGVYDRACGIPSNHTSYPTNAAAVKKRSIWNITAAIGIGTIVCLLCSVLCLFLWRRYHKKKKSTAYLTHNKSYSPSRKGSVFPYINGSTYFGVHVFNYKELEEATEYFSPFKELGKGGFGTVYHGKLRDGREVAIKRLYDNNSKRAELFINEVEILANLGHKNLVNLYGCTARENREFLLVYEYVPNGTVADHLHGKQSKVRTLPWSTRLSIATQTASALVYLHESDIVHRDVKTQNILLDNDFSVKVADFGLSRLFPLDVTHVSTAPQGTPGYVDPEYHQCYQLTEKSDVYSFGVMLAELISSLPAVDITRKRNEINLSNMAINKIRDGAMHEFVDPSLGFESDFRVEKVITQVGAIAFQCLQSTKEMRPSMNDVYKRLLAVQSEQGSKVDSAEVVDIPADDVIMLKGDFSPPSPPRDPYFDIRYYKPNASV